jgi:pimeloyl-ACP methyl ester carboxylesterase
MISISVVVAVVVLVLITLAGAALIDHAYPQAETSITVNGATLNVVDVGPILGPREATPPIVLIHGASCNLEAMRQPLGDLLARKHRVILIDRPGHGRSVRERETDSTPDVQAHMIDEGLQKLGLDRVILVVHSLAGALGARMALDHPQRLAGLMMLAPVTHPWRGGVGWYNKAVTTPVIGRLLAYTITLPLGLIIAKQAARNVFLPQTMPDNFVSDTATPLLLRPREFLANAYDLITLKAAVAAQAPRYAEIRTPVTIISGDVDKTVLTNIHSRPFAATVPNAKLIVLPGMGHMIQNAVPDIVVTEIEVMIGKVLEKAGAAAG